MHRFCVPGSYAPGQELTLPPEEAAHALKVLRLREGDEVEVFNGEGARFSAVLTAVGKAEATVRVEDCLPDTEPPVRVTLYQGLPKADKLDFIAQKITELGACRLVPVAMSRCVAKAEGKEAAKKAERLSRIALEAAKQCGRGRVPEILPAMSWKQALSRLREHELVIVPWEEARGMNLRTLHERHPDARDLAIVIGPEGGISPEEIAEMAGEAVTLGPRILRTETAAVAAMTLAMSLWGDI